MGVRVALEGAWCSVRIGPLQCHTQALQFQLTGKVDCAPR